MLGSVSDCENMYRILHEFYVNDSWKYAEKYYKEGFRIVALSRKRFIIVRVILHWMKMFKIFSLEYELFNKSLLRKEKMMYVVSIKFSG